MSMQVHCDLCGNVMTPTKNRLEMMLKGRLENGKTVPIKAVLTMIAVGREQVGVETKADVCPGCESAALQSLAKKHKGK